MRRRVSVVQQGPRPPRPLGLRLLWNSAEVAVTLGLVLLLLVAHQLWWTNRQARAAAERKVEALEEAWAASPDGEPGPAAASRRPSGSPPRASSEGGDRPSPRDGRPPAEATGGSAAASGASEPRWDQAYAVLRIPRIGIRVPVGEGVSKGAVLNQGYAGHYPRTARPGQAGNFALAGHRNTHGEPFRYINRLRRGDEIEVRTADARYTYVVDKTLARTSARDSGVIRSVPRSDVRKGYGYRDAGYYITLTTCTPEYTSKYRLVVWGKLRSMRPG